MYGFTFILWNHLVKPLMEEGICLNLPKARILHSGGWKRLQDQAVEKTEFNQQLARTFGCSPDRIIDFYGMVETVGVIYPDCSEGNKHGPAFGDVIVRDPLTLEPVAAGRTWHRSGLQCSADQLPRPPAAHGRQGSSHCLRRLPLWETGHQFPLCRTHSQS